MNDETLKKLLSNPHYKMGKLARNLVERRPMIEFGKVDKHTQKVPLHDVGMQRIPRTHN